MRFLFQTPSQDLGSKVSYDAESHNLYTINEPTADASFYQTFGDLVLNFDHSTGRLYSVNGRIDLAGGSKGKCSKLPNADFAYLVTDSLRLDAIASEVAYGFDSTTRILVVRASQQQETACARVLENVVVGLTKDNELASVYIEFAETV